jgi:hypothetical protein
VAKLEKDGCQSWRGMGVKVGEGWVAKFLRPGWLSWRGMGG